MASESRQWRSFDAVLSHTPDFAYTFDLEGRFTYVNAALLKLWQRTLEDALGKNFFELDYTPELAVKLQRQIQQVVDTSDPVRDQTPYTGANGKTGIYEYIFVPVLGTDGRVEAVAGSTRDITELIAGQRRFQQLADAMPQIVWTATADGALDYVNEQLTLYSGITHQDALSAGWLSLVHPEDLEHAAARWRYSLATAESYEAECRLRSASGEWRYHLVRALATREASGSIAHWFGTCTDIQSQRNIEAELARSNAELAMFAHVAAHDLQSPLRTVKIYAQLLEKKIADKLDDPARLLMATVLEGADRMNQLIHALLTYAQVNQGNYVRQPVAMNAIFAETIAHLSPLAAEAGADVSADDLPGVQADAVQISQLMQNLISNALKYHRPEEPPRVRISAVKQPSGWLFEIRDNGQGIPEDYREVIFHPMKRLHGYDVPGTGIGLAVCRKIVERHGGRIWVEPAPGQGSSFFFTLAE